MALRSDYTSFPCARSGSFPVNRRTVTEQIPSHQFVQRVDKSNFGQASQDVTLGRLNREGTQAKTDSRCTALSERSSFVRGRL
jgi:hypothetical protein